MATVSSGSASVIGSTPESDPKGQLSRLVEGDTPRTIDAESLPDWARRYFTDKQLAGFTSPGMVWALLVGASTAMESTRKVVAFRVHLGTMGSDVKQWKTTLSYLAAQTGLSESTVESATKDLEADGWFEVVRSHRKPNVYRLTWPQEDCLSSVSGLERCGAETKKGKVCTRRAGRGTDTPGVGPCHLHPGAPRITQSGVDAHPLESVRPQRLGSRNSESLPPKEGLDPSGWSSLTPAAGAHDPSGWGHVLSESVKDVRHTPPVDGGGGGYTRARAREAAPKTTTSLPQRSLLITEQNFPLDDRMRFHVAAHAARLKMTDADIEIQYNNWIRTHVDRGTCLPEGEVMKQWSGWVARADGRSKNDAVVATPDQRNKADRLTNDWITLWERRGQTVLAGTRAALHKLMLDLMSANNGDLDQAVRVLRDINKVCPAEWELQEALNVDGWKNMGQAT